MNGSYKFEFFIRQGTERNKEPKGWKKIKGEVHRKRMVNVLSPSLQERQQNNGLLSIALSTEILCY